MPLFLFPYILETQAQSFLHGFRNEDHSGRRHTGLR